MPLQEELERSGLWLFRWRSYLPLALIVVVLAAMRGYRYPGGSETLAHVWEGFCVLVSFFGLAIRVFTVGHTPRATSGRNTKRQVADSLNTTGIYSLVRHPLYLGNFFMYLGIVLFPCRWWLVLIYILAFWLYYERIMFAEEAFLKRKFGDEFLAWARNTPAFLPRFSSYRKPAFPFSLRKVLRKEYNGFFAVVVVMFVLEELGEVVLNGRPSVDIGWVVILSLGFVLWATLRVLKKTARLLREPER